MEVENKIKRYRTNTSNYDKSPFVQVTNESGDCKVGWSAILETLQSKITASAASRNIIVIETYHGVNHKEISGALSQLMPDFYLDVRTLYKPEEQLDLLLEETLGDHPIFGYMSNHQLLDFLDPSKLRKAANQIAQMTDGLVIIQGAGAILVHQHPDVLVYADMARWEIQQRMRKGQVANLGSQNFSALITEKYKRAYFVDWRVCDKIKRQIFDRWDFLLDTNQHENPKLVTGELVRIGLRKTVSQPFRVVPFFDPGVWGGQWMREVCDLSAEPPNFAWCFDCVPEENSLCLAYGRHKVELPAINLVFAQTLELLGEKIKDRFGAEFPIRFDFLDTMDGGNLSLQVHPTRGYMQEHFGLPYTQDESYYLLDAEEDAVVYLGQKENIDHREMIADLERAQKGSETFPADKYVQKWPVKKHDHILIPAGTVHCSGKNSMVLEISATPYIFTFKLWDWGRVDLDGKPRTISIDHGKAVIEWDRTTEWVAKELVNQVEHIAAGDGWREERTGLHALEFIETRRHWFTKKVNHHTKGNLHVLNLVEGDEVVVESPTGAFAPFFVHYAETFIVPAGIGAYTIRPTTENTTSEYATLKAYVR